MPLKDVYLVSRKLDLFTELEIEELENELDFPLPLGYREYLTTLGKGTFCQKLELCTPAEVLDPGEREFWVKKMAPIIIEEGLYQADVLLTLEELTGSYIFARTSEGDTFVACPQKPGQLFELPRHENKMRHYPDGFLEPFQFGIFQEEFNLPFFEPEGSRQEETCLYPRNAAETQAVWDYVAALSKAPLQVVEGKIGVTKRTIAFIPDVQGCAWFDNKEFYFFAVAESAPVIRQLAQKFKKLTEEPSDE